MRITVDQVISLNKIDQSLDPDFVLKHIQIATNEIDYELGTDTTFDITTTAYPHFYDEAIIRLTYAMMLPEMHIHYKTEYPNMDAEMDTFYLSPNQVKIKVGELKERVNLLISRLKDEISEQSNSLVTGKAIFSAAGGNKSRVEKYRLRDHYDRMDTILGVNNDDQS